MRHSKSWLIISPPYRNFTLVQVRKLRNISWLRKKIGYTSVDPVIIDDKQLMIRNRKINYHDFYHLEVSQLERIKMGKDMVSGIHGINSPYFHEKPIIEEYDSSLDEGRVAVHQWLTKTSVASTFKILIWIIWFLLNRINPIAIIWRHRQSLKNKK